MGHTPADLLSQISITASSALDVSTLQAHDNLSPPATIQTIPNEILVHIFGFLDGPHPSTLALLDEPTFEVTQAGVADLKAVSLVSKQWRQAILPVLFRHARLVVAKSAGVRPALKQEIQPFIDFTRRGSLYQVITSLTLVVEDKKVERPYRLNNIGTFWEALFDTIDPAELLIVAPVEALGALTSCNIYMEDAWAFDSPCHYLRLQRPPVHDNSALSQNIALPGESCKGYEAKAPKTREDIKLSSSSHEYPSLFEIRRWSSLLLNEGSFIKAYSTSEFWLRQPPSILPDLVGEDDDEQNSRMAHISPTIREMSYIGIFPMASHFSALTTSFPRLDRFYVQLVPRNDILSIPGKMAYVQGEDLWMERNSCYALLMRELFGTPPLLNYRYIQIFESGDAADREAWSMAVEYVKRVNNGWKPVADGVFLRDPKDLAQGAREGEEANLSSFQGALFKWAWNGTAELPVSPRPLYEQ